MPLPPAQPLKKVTLHAIIGLKPGSPKNVAWLFASSLGCFRVFGYACFCVAGVVAWSECASWSVECVLCGAPQQPRQTDRQLQVGSLFPAHHKQIWPPLTLSKLKLSVYIRRLLWFNRRPLWYQCSRSHQLRHQSRSNGSLVSVIVALTWRWTTMESRVVCGVRTLCPWDFVVLAVSWEESKPWLQKKIRTVVATWAQRVVSVVWCLRRSILLDRLVDFAGLHSIQSTCDEW